MKVIENLLIVFAAATAIVVGILTAVEKDNLAPSDDFSDTDSYVSGTVSSVYQTTVHGAVSPGVTGDGSTKTNPGLSGNTGTSGIIIADRVFGNSLDYFTAYCDSSVYNVELANMTAALSCATYEEKELKSAYNSLGFYGVTFCDYDEVFSPASSPCAIGFKKSVYNDDTICLVSIRGTQNLSDWIGNIAIATFEDEKHVGFAYPANRIYDNIEKMVKERNITGKIKYVLTGHSRGGAVANLLAVKLMENGVSAADVYNYNFGCPDVARKENFPIYNNIFNLCNRADLVPFVPGVLAGAFTDEGDAVWGKFGRTYWFTLRNDDRSGVLPEHDISLYLEYMDRKLDLSD